MARLSQAELSRIKGKILGDIYGDSESGLEKRKTLLAKRNRQYVMDPLMPLIDKLPNDLFVKNSRYDLYVNYNTKQQDKRKALSETWVYIDNTPQGKHAINPLSKGYFNMDMRRGNLVPQLQQEAKELCEDVIKIRNEKDDLKKYLDETTDKYTGTKQLRKIWPEYLHKYLPADSPKNSVPNSTAIKVLEATIPNFIQQRLTSNLLEK